jgi:DNA-directed RNA polymerase specialized sigma24 family protein
MPICIPESIYRQCLHLGLNPDDAHDCVAEVCLRYHKRTGAFPHDEETPDLRLLRLLTLNVVREHQRTQQRRLRLEQDYLAQQRQQHASAPTPMAQAIARVDCERFRAQLPDYLRRTLELMEAGDTPKAIAARLGVAVGTVYSYQRELRERFVEFFGYDPRKSGVRVVNYSGCSEASSSDNTQEVRNDATAEGTWCSGVVVSRSEPDCAAQHPECSSRLTRGGGSDGSRDE